MSLDLSRLLKPRSIAVVGGGWGVAVVEQCLKMGFKGDIWPVHPTRDDIHGIPCISSVADLPAAPDATFIGVNRHLTIQAVRELSKMGAGGAVCFASGFAEAEDDRSAGAELQVELLDAAADMPILGPNCYGLINYLDGALLWPDQHGGKRVEQGVAIITQSSNVLINLTMQRRGLPMAYCLTAGNQAQTGLAELAMAVLQDRRVTALGLHIEGISDIRAFEAMAAMAREYRKPLVALKVGRSEQAQAATISHTASLAGGDAASRAFLRRLGIPQAGSLPEFLETLKLLHVHGPLPGRRLSSMSCSGGEASLIADAAHDLNVEFPTLDTAQHDRIKATLSDLVTVSNPLDYHTFIWDDAKRMAKTYAAMLGCGFDLNLLVYDFPRVDRADDAAWACGQIALDAAVQETGARSAMVASLPENMPEDRAAALMAEGIVPLMGLDDALKAASSAADIHEAWNEPPPLAVVNSDMVEQNGRELETHTINEAEAKAMLAAYGLRVPNGGVAENPVGAAQLAAGLVGEMVVKGLGFAHKTEAGAVRLNLSNTDEVLTAAQSMPGAGGFLVEEMVGDAVAELIVGVVRDPVYGFTLTIGAGGTLTELLDDSVTLLMPSTRQCFRKALETLKVFRVLCGYRGKPAADIDAILDAIEAVQRFVTEHADKVHELDINPLIATPVSVVAVDALMIQAHG